MAPSERSPDVVLGEEERLWREIRDLVAAFPGDAASDAGYFPEGWSAKDALAHIGTWLAEGKARLERIHAGTYEREDLDDDAIDALNARFLEVMADQPWSVVWVQANAARTLLLGAWFELEERSDDADWWLRKVGPDHYDEHLGRLREWAAELRGPSAPHASPA